MTPDCPPLGWIRPLAEPYLRGFPCILQQGGELRGYWFARPAPRAPDPPRRKWQSAPGRSSGSRFGFFVGYLVGAEGYGFLNPHPPECLVFAFVEPVGGPLHRQLVGPADSLWRRTFTYIRWLTHRPPRFEFHENELPAMVRHCPMGDWPRDRYQHFSRNFFVETLAWLVRSGLVQKLLSDTLVAGARSSFRKCKA